jgi:seryl-tRNA synthetase
MSKEKKSVKENKDIQMQEDCIAHGLKRLDPKIVSGHPPRIKWGDKYADWTDAEKVPYLETLACSMNNAADLIQIERNELNEICAMKDKQVKKISEAMEQNMNMLQSEMTNMNTQRQDYHACISDLNKKVKELEETIKNSVEG